jgi:hypothetical protein
MAPQIKPSLVTPLMWESYDAWSSSFGYIWTNPIEWNSLKKILVYNKPSRKLFPYFFSILFCLPLYTISSLGLLLSGFFGVVKLSIVSIFVTLFFLLVAILDCVIETCFLVYGNDWVNLLNSVNILEKYLQPTELLKKNKWKNINLQILGQRKVKSRVKKIILQTTSKIKEFHVDPVGLILNLIARLFGFYPYFVVLFAVILFPIDVFSQLVNYSLLPGIILHNFYANRLYFIVRIPITLIFAIQVCRTLPFLVVSGTVACYLTLSCISHLERITRESMAFCKYFQFKDKISQIFSKYDELAIVLNIGQYYISSTCITAMSGVFIIDVVCNFVTLKLYHVIPMPFYLYFPSVSVVLPILIMTLVPIIVNTYENGNDLRIKWGQNCIHHGSISEMKYLKRRLKGIRVVRVYGGILGYNLYVMNNSLKAAFLFEIINYTINALLSIPSK